MSIAGSGGKINSRSRERLHAHYFIGGAAKIMAFLRRIAGWHDGLRRGICGKTCTAMTIN